ncbi:MAG: TetR/AcrR family transcriptional regulator [Myxococcales bacterium]|nr:TetR/AcrR family transcriptional regulator [Myxococcales bacterium]
MSRRPDPAASRRAILQAARVCFSARGYAGTSMHDIAKAAGVTQSLIHHHFGPKDALWAEVRRFAFGEYAQQQRTLITSGRGEPEVVRESMATYFRFLAQNPDILRLVAWLELDRPVAFIEELRELRDAGVRVIEDGQRSGWLRGDLPARFILTAFLGLVRNWFEERTLVQDESDPAAVAQADADYLEAMWLVFSQGALTRAHQPALPSTEPSTEA